MEYKELVQQLPQNREDLQQAQQSLAKRWGQLIQKKGYYATTPDGTVTKIHDLEKHYRQVLLPRAKKVIMGVKKHKRYCYIITLLKEYFQQEPTITTSCNRKGQHSWYAAFGNTTVRISDHNSRNKEDISILQGYTNDDIINTLNKI